MELIPLALALVVLWKVESSHADGNADMEFYRRKLAEHCDRCDSCRTADKIEPIHDEAKHNREATAATDGDLRRKAP